MKKETIMNTYAVEQGYENWEELENLSNNLTFHIKEVAQLIQDELLSKVTEDIKNLLESEKVGEIFIEDYQVILKTILNTENIK